MTRICIASVFPTGIASLNSRSIRCTSDDLAYGVTTAMSVLIYRRFGGSGPRYLSPSLRSLFSFLSLSPSRVLRRLSFPFALIRHFLPCSAAGKRLKKDRASQPLDRSIEGRRTLAECARRLTMGLSFSFFLSVSISLLLSSPSMLSDDDDSGYHRRRNSCAMTRRAHFTRARAKRKRHKDRPRS